MYAELTNGEYVVVKSDNYDDASNPSRRTSIHALPMCKEFTYDCEYDTLDYYPVDQIVQIYDDRIDLLTAVKMGNMEELLIDAYTLLKVCNSSSHVLNALTTEIPGKSANGYSLANDIAALLDLPVL